MTETMRCTYLREWAGTAYAAWCAAAESGDRQWFEEARGVYRTLEARLSAYCDPTTTPETRRSIERYVDERVAELNSMLCL